MRKTDAPGCEQEWDSFRKKHFGGSLIMKQLLENEGIRIKDDIVVDFEKLFWDPCMEL